MIKKTVAIALVATTLAGCTGTGTGIGPREGIGTVGGAVAGGLLGSTIGRGRGNTAAIVVGALAGGLIGSAIGRHLDEEDRQRAYNAEYSALQSGSSSRWSNPRTGRYGTVAPGPVYNSGYNVCRNYTHTIYIDGRPEQARGTACRNPDGSWTPTS